MRRIGRTQLAAIAAALVVSAAPALGQSRGQSEPPRQGEAAPQAPQPQERPSLRRRPQPPPPPPPPAPAPRQEPNRENPSAELRGLLAPRDRA